MSDKPMGVLPLCIIAIFLGVMGVLGGAMGIFGLMFEQKPIPPDKNPKMTEVNSEFERRIKALTKESRPFSLAVIPTVMAASALLAAAGLAGINLKALGLLKIAFAVNLLVDLGAAVYQSVIQIKTLGIMKWYFGEVAAASGAGAATPAMEMTMTISLYAGLFFGVFWLAMKLAYYVVGLVYFNKRAIADAFSGRPAPEAAV